MAALGTVEILPVVPLLVVTGYATNTAYPSALGTVRILPVVPLLTVSTYRIAGTAPTGGYPAPVDVRDDVVYGASHEYVGELVIADPVYPGFPTEGIIWPPSWLNPGGPDMSEVIAELQADVAQLQLDVIALQGGGYPGSNAQTGTTYTVVLTDAGKLVTLNNAAAVTVTIPPASSVAFPLLSRIDFAGLGVGLVTFAPGAGVTLSATPSLVTRARYSAVTAVKIATDSWLLVGDLA